MKKYSGWILLIAGLMLGLSTNAFAASGSLKVGYFDANQAMVQSQWGKKVVDELKREHERVNNELEEKGKTYKAARDEYEKKRDVMDDKARNRKQKELQDMAVEMEKLANDATQKYNKRAQEVRAPLYQKVSEIVTRIGKDEKYDYILERGSLHFANERDDLTKKIVAELDKSSPK
ncbi:MAG: OmpH family outer membrane protein [Desulfobacteraceae bacterium]|nr:OmpH family outer membrane protein [Desulfobacteraceae bacterium]